MFEVRDNQILQKLNYEFKEYTNNNSTNKLKLNDK